MYFVVMCWVHQNQERRLQRFALLKIVILVLFIMVTHMHVLCFMFQQILVVSVCKNWYEQALDALVNMQTILKSDLFRIFFVISFIRPSIRLQRRSCT